MNKKIAVIWISLTIILTSVVILIEIAPKVKASTTWYVDDVPGSSGPDDPPENYTSIQAAIDNANSGDTVFVYAGYYTENIVVDKTLNLIGENRSKTIIDGNNSGDVIKISADWNTVTGFTIIRSGTSAGGNAGIGIRRGSYCKIEDNNCSNNLVGIYIDYGNNNNVLNNICILNTNGIFGYGSKNRLKNNNCSYNSLGIGIDKPGSYDNIIENNTCSQNRGYCGINIRDATYTTIKNNTCTNNPSGINLAVSNYNTIENNTCLYNSRGINLGGNNNIIKNTTSSNNSQGIYFYRANGNSISNNVFSDNLDYNIIVDQSGGNTIENNSCISSDCGIYLWRSSNNNIISENNISDSSKNLYLYSSSNNIINNNNITNSWYGIYLYKASNNDISNNSLVGNLNAIYAIDSESIDARFNYFGTTYQNRIEKLVYTNVINGVDYSNWLKYRESSVQYIEGAVAWTNPITLEKGIIINGSLSISTKVTFNNPYGQNFIYVNGTLQIANANFTSNVGNYTIVYLNDTLGDVIESTFTRQRVLGSHREAFEILNNTFMFGKIGIGLCMARNNNITGNNFSANSVYGIYIDLSSYNNINNNNISNNKNSVTLQTSINNKITNNNVWNGFYGITFISSSNNNIINNCISNNSKGIYLLSSSINNSIYHNNILYNTNQAYDDSNNANQWDNGYPSGGNFWSDYTGDDKFSGPNQDQPGNDGIGDVNYSIDSDSRDNYPLMSSIGNNIFLYQGWNLISVPFIQPDTNLDTVLSSIKGSYDAVQWYDVNDSSDPWKHSSTKKPPPLNDFDDINHKMGFWIHITEPDGVLFQYPGIKPMENQTINIHPGWNLIGYPSITSHNRTKGLNNLTFGSDIDSIWTYNAATQKWKEITASDNFEVGRGYWIHSKVTKTWIVPL